MEKEAEELLQRIALARSGKLRYPVETAELASLVLDALTFTIKQLNWLDNQLNQVQYIGDLYDPDE